MFNAIAIDDKLTLTDAEFEQISDGAMTIASICTTAKGAGAGTAGQDYPTGTL